jgi:hypothetical protein
MVAVGAPEASPLAVRYESGVREACDLAMRRVSRNPYRPEPTWWLKDQQEYWGFALIEAQLRQADDPETDRSFELHTAKANLELIERELTRRRNLVKDSGRRPEMDLERRKWVDYAGVKEAVRLEFAVDRLAAAPLHKRGSILTTNCMLPGHDDSTPSFTVWPETQTWKCFGCGRGGDVIELARHWFGQDNAAIAAEHLCMLLGVDVPRSTDKPLPTRPHLLGPKGVSLELDESDIRPIRRRGGR